MSKYLTVNELIRELQQYPPDMEIWTANQTVGGNTEWLKDPSPFGETVEPVGMIQEKRIKDQKIVRRPCKETAGAKKVLVVY